MVHDAAVDLFGYPHIEAAVPGFHMESRNLTTLGGDDSHAAIGVTEYQKGFWLDLGQHLVHRNNDVPDGLCP
ncbi:hypothetical protein D3C79_1056200 [compost metagenome]